MLATISFVVKALRPNEPSAFCAQSHPFFLIRGEDLKSLSRLSRHLPYNLCKKCTGAKKLPTLSPLNVRAVTGELLAKVQLTINRLIDYHSTIKYLQIKSTQVHKIIIRQLQVNFALNFPFHPHRHFPLLSVRGGRVSILR
jgi:hypothetical protein